MPSAPIDSTEPGAAGSADDGGADGGRAVDGRTARRQRNRDAVLDAVLDLFTEGRLSPSPPEVAERSGVSLRSVYRYFEDEDTLVRSAIAHNIERVRPYMAFDRPGDGPLESRIRRTVAARLKLFERGAPIMRAAIHASPTTPVLAARLDEVRAQLRDQVAEMFSPELSSRRPDTRRETLDAVELVLSYEGIHHLRDLLGRSADDAGATMRRSLRALLDAS